MMVWFGYVSAVPEAGSPFLFRTLPAIVLARKGEDGKNTVVLYCMWAFHVLERCISWQVPYLMMTEQKQRAGL